MWRIFFPDERSAQDVSQLLPASSNAPPNSPDAAVNPSALESRVSAATRGNGTTSSAAFEGVRVRPSTSQERTAVDGLMCLGDLTASYARSAPSPAGSPLDLSMSSSRNFILEDDSSNDNFNENSNDSGFALRDYGRPHSRTSSLGSGDTSESERSVLPISHRRQSLKRKAKIRVSYADDQNGTPESDMGGGAAGKGRKRTPSAKRGAGGRGGRGGKSNENNMANQRNKKAGIEAKFFTQFNLTPKNPASQVKFSGVTYSSSQKRMSSLDPPLLV